MYICLHVGDREGEMKGCAKEKERVGGSQSVDVRMSGCLGGCACEAAKSFKLGKGCGNARWRF